VWDLYEQSGNGTVLDLSAVAYSSKNSTCYFICRPDMENGGIWGSSFTLKNPHAIPRMKDTQTNFKNLHEEY